MTTKKKKIPLMKSAFFWNKVADVLGLFGTGGLVALDVNNAAQKWTWIVGAITALVQVIRLLFTDSNRNNIPDILEEQEAEIHAQEVTVAVTENPEGGPPIVDVTQTTVTKP